MKHFKIKNPDGQVILFAEAESKEAVYRFVVSNQEKVPEIINLNYTLEPATEQEVESAYRLQMSESFKGLGLTEKAAKIAAAGREAVYNMRFQESSIPGKSVRIIHVK